MKAKRRHGIASATNTQANKHLPILPIIVTDEAPWQRPMAQDVHRLTGTIEAATPPDVIPVVVFNAAGRWCCGYELLETNADGSASIRSSHTGNVRRLPQDQWRDPLEVALLCAERAAGLLGVT